VLKPPLTGPPREGRATTMAYTLPAEPPGVPDVVATKIAEAYYPRGVAFADSARARARAGYTIACAVPPHSLPRGCSAI
jgi:hypothetical protein